MAGRLRLRRYLLEWAYFYRLGRKVISAVLMTSLVAAAWQYFAHPAALVALEFTRHVVGTQTGAVGVLGIDSTDFDGDGDIDIVTAGLDGIKVYIQNEGDFEEKLIDDKDGERVQVADFNNDGLQDLLVTLKANPSVRWYENRGDNEFEGADIGIGDLGAAAAGDINGDGTVDVVTSTRDGGDNFVLRRWMNDGNGSFSSVTLHSDADVRALAIGDINGNGYQDVITGGDGGLQYWSTSDGAVTWSRADVDDDHDNKTALAVADVNDDGKNDIVTGDQAANTVAYYRNVDGEPFVRTELSTETDATSVQVVDLDEDGREDILVAGQDDNSVYWFRNDGDAFEREEIASLLQTVFVAKAVDVDDDNDFDVVAADHYRGTVYWYERVAAKPVSTVPSNIRQTSDGAGRVTFDVTISDGDYDPTRLRVQYSINGTQWYKPWLLKVTPAEGSVDLKNSNGYQVGTSNSIDTNVHDSVKLTLLWDTKSIENTGGPISGDVSTVQLRVIPYDGKAAGAVATSSKFRVDNSPPAGLSNLRMTEVGPEAVKLAWDKPTDSSEFSYEIYYDTSATAVLDRKSDVWNAEDDEALGDFEAVSTTITGLSSSTPYTFKIFATDSFGNLVGAPSIRGSTLSTSASPGATPFPESSPTPEPSTLFTPSPTPSLLFPSPSQSAGPSAESSPTPLNSPLPVFPSPVLANDPPLADAGVDQVVNQSALVILDGTDSTDSDGDNLSFRWRQLSGPTVELLSERTATPSFSAGDEGEAYIFALTVQDEKGGSATDTVTVATKELVLAESPVPVETGAPPTIVEEEESGSQLGIILQPLNWGLFTLSALATLATLFEQLWRSMRRSGAGAGALQSEGVPRGKVVHYQTGEPVAGVRVLVYGEDGKLRRTETTTSRGEFPTDFPPGKYTLGIQATGFAFAPAASKGIVPDDGILYSGGSLVIEERKPITVVVPLKPMGQKVGSLRTRVLQGWQIVQRLARLLSWPLFVAGALLNTFLIFWMPSVTFLVLEVLYVVLVVIKVVLEVRVRPAYGMVRDAITHVPLDLAVVRLYDQKTNRLIMTRVADNQGKFFALPPAGLYRVTITKPGYAVFSKDSVQISSEQDSVLQMTADLMPVAPMAAMSARPLPAS